MALKDEISPDGRLLTGESCEEFIQRKLREDPKAKALWDAMDPNDPMFVRAFVHVFGSLRNENTDRRT
jgi:hypothetical protein